jgi:hypothetical protein
VFWSFILASRPEEAEADPIMNLVRLPASLPGSLPAQIPGMNAAVKPMDPIEMDVMKVPCWDKSGLEESTGAKWVRLTGRDCWGDAGSDGVTVRNLSNGFSATVFPTQGRAGLTTDFIPLEMGKNSLEIRFNPVQKGAEGPQRDSQINFVRE